MFRLYVSLALFAVFIDGSLSVDDSGCGVTKWCVRFPQNCVPTFTNCMLFTYAWNDGTNSFDMELSGGFSASDRYVAVAFASTARMQDAEMYYCTPVGLGSGTIRDLYFAPTVDPSLPTTITNAVTSTINGVTQCTFTRSALVNRTVSGNKGKVFDLSSERFHVLLASGIIAGGVLEYHRVNRWASSTSLNLATPLNRSTAATNASSKSLSPSCPQGWQCATNIEACQPGENLCIFVAWKYDSASNSFDITFSGRTSNDQGYVAIAFSFDKLMEDAELYYCTGRSLKTGSIGIRYFFPNVDSTLPSEITNPTANVTNGLMTCSFTRVSNVTKDTSNNQRMTFDFLSTDFYLLFASGASSPDGSLTYHHANRWSSSSAMSFTDGFQAAPTEHRAGTSPSTGSTDQTNSGCGITRHCLQSIANCSASDPNCILLSWTYDQGPQTFDMQIVGRGQAAAAGAYVAIAFASSQSMEDADLYYCTGTQLKSGTIKEKYFTPTTDNVLSAAVSNPIVDATDGVFTCFFTRPASVIRTVTGDLQQDFNLVRSSYYVLFASGLLDNAGNIQYHFKKRWFSGKETTFVPNPTTTTPSSVTSLTTAAMAGCGITKQCVKNIPDCVEGTAGCILFSWKYDSSSKLYDLEISGRLALSQYIAFAFSFDRLMKDADLYYCTGTELKSGSIRERYFTPSTDAALPTEVSNVQASKVNGIAVCSFSRTASATKTASGNSNKIYDLSANQFYVLFASGAYPGGDMAYHFSNRWFTPNPIDFSIKTTTTATSAVTTTSSKSSCGVGQQCVSNVPGCLPGQSSCIQLSWKYDESKSNFDMELSGGDQAMSGYVGVAFGSTGQMENADFYYCTRDSVKSGAIREQYLPPVPDNPLPEKISNTSASFADGVMRCRFTRDASVTKVVSNNVPKTFDLAFEDHHVLFVGGNIADKELQYHGTNRWSTQNKTKFVDRSRQPTTTATTSSLVPTAEQTTTVLHDPIFPLSPSSTLLPTSSSSSSTPAVIQSTQTEPTSTEGFTEPLRPTVTKPAPSSTSGCGSTKGCFSSPDKCTPGSDGCTFASWKHNPEDNTFDVEIIGGSATNQYVSIAFSDDRFMSDADMYYCTESELFSGALQSLQTSPAVFPTPVEITNVAVGTINGMMSCSFTRASAVSKKVSGQVLKTFDLAKSNYFVLLATGNVAGESSLTYHGLSRHASTRAFNFTLISEPQPPNTETSSPSSSSITSTTDISGSTRSTETPSAENDFTSGCQSSKGCFRSPPRCLPGSPGCMFVSWTQNNDKSFDFEIIGGTGTANQYAAIAFSSNDEMSDADMYYCTSSSVKSGVIRAAKISPVTDPTLVEISNVAYGSTNEVVKCSFTRPASVKKEISGSRVKDFNLVDNDYYILYAVGMINPSDGEINYHGTGRGVSGSAQNFTDIASETSSSATDYKQALVKAHASLMLVAWLTCASIGTLIARHFKPLFHGSTCCGTKVWFQLHRGLMSAAVITTIVAFVLIFVSVEGYSENAGAHPIIGIIVTALAVVNPIMALFRPHPDAKRRSVFNWGHWLVGMSACILGIAAIFLGIELQRLDLDRWVTWALVAFVIFHFLTEIIMEILSAVYGHIAAYKKQKKVENIPLGDELDHSGPQPKGTSIKYAIMCLYAVVNIAFLVVFIVAIALH